MCTYPKRGVKLLDIIPIFAIEITVFLKDRYNVYCVSFLSSENKSYDLGLEERITV